MERDFWNKYVLLLFVTSLHGSVKASLMQSLKTMAGSSQANPKLGVSKVENISWKNAQYTM